MVVGSSKDQNRFLLLYGTATGQSKAIAEEIAEKSPSYGLTADLFELDDIGKKFNLEKERCVVIVVSTTGDGDPPPNAEKFMRRIKKRILSSTYLAHLHYALLGLGDSNYSNFCRCGRDMNTRLEALGARPFHPPGFADDGVGLEVVADPWLKDLYPALQNFLGVHPANQAPVTETVSSKSHSKVAGAVDSTDSSKEKGENLTISSNGDNSSKVTLNGDSVAPVISSDSIPNPNNQTSQSELSSNGDAKDIDQIDSKKQNGSLTNSIAGDKQTESVAEKTAAVNLNSNVSSQVLDADPNTEIVSKNVSADLLAIRAANRSQCVNSVSGQVWPETPCKMLDKESDLDLCGGERLETSPLLSSQSPLCDQDLTIPVLPPPYLDITFCDSSVELTSLTHQNSCKLPSAASDVFNVRVSEVQVLTSPDAVKKTLLLRLSLEGTSITYHPGDSISIICPNSQSEVDLLIQRLKLEDVADQKMTITVKPDTKKRRAAVPAHIHPSGSTLRHVFTSCVSLRDPPSKALLRTFVEFTKEESDVRRLQELCSKEGGQDYTRCLRQGNVTLLDFLSAFPSCLPPPETLLEHLPRLQPRPYSACSSQKVTPNSLDLVFNVVEVKGDLAADHYYHRRGVCTGWMDDMTTRLQRGEQREEKILVPVFLRTNQHFQPPTDLSRPLIMIGPGTGVAPFIGFLEERGVQRKDLENSEGADSKYGETWLYFGCRNKDKDFLFREKLEEFESNGVLTNLRVTFSRDSISDEQVVKATTESSATNVEDETSKSSAVSDVPDSANPDPVPSPSPRYVQDQMRKDSEALARLLTESEALVYVCGDAKNMAADVAAAFEDILQTEKGMTKEEAHMFVMKKRIHKTYLEDVWL